MPEPVFAEFNACALLYRFIGFLESACHNPDRLWFFGQDHTSGQDVKCQLLSVCFEQTPDDGAKPVTPSAIGIVTIIQSRAHRSEDTTPAASWSERRTGEPFGVRV